MPTRFELWAWSRVIAYRIGLTLTYGWAIFIGVNAFFAGIPIFRSTAPDGWAQGWAVVVVIGAIVATVGTFKDERKYEIVEMVGASALFALFLSYGILLLFAAYFGGDADRATVGAFVLGAGVSPGVRVAWLISQLGLRK